MADHDAGVVVVSLTRDEALVLSDWLHRCEDEDALADVTSDPAEVVALDALSALLERELVELFDPNYLELVEAARHRLRSSSD